MDNTTRKLDQAIEDLDDWDLLQAAFENMIEEAYRSCPNMSADATIEKEFPSHQSKTDRETRLKRMLSYRNLTSYGQEFPKRERTPSDILEDALTRILNERRLSQQKTVRQLLSPYLDTSVSVTNEQGLQYHQRIPWTRHFRSDFWEFLAKKKIKGDTWFPPVNNTLKTNLKLTSSEIRTLNALKEASPKGYTVKELCKLIVKDALSEETPSGSMGTWVNTLKHHGLARAEKEKRSNRWYFVKDYES